MGVILPGKFCRELKTVNSPHRIRVNSEWKPSFLCMHCVYCCHHSLRRSCSEIHGDDAICTSTHSICKNEEGHGREN